MLRSRFIGALALAALVSPPVLAPREAHAAAAGVSGTASIIPGLGQVINGNALEGLGWFSSVAALSFSGNGYFAQIGFDLWMYNMYDAYRDARPQNGRFTNYGVVENYVAAFNPLNIVDPIGAPIVAYGAYAGSSRGYPGLRNVSKPLLYGFVGEGEEGLFRGFLFPGLSDVFSSKLVGALTSSAIFAVSHATGGSSNLAGGALAQRFAGGMLFCWQANLNRYDLRHGIFAHAWYDILVDRGRIAGLSVKFPLP
ncbi:MAG: CPBP family intramembrane metalloprotease [Deltaproteobacteria bacterium]|nr:CPBP family intramembrane metalloprotease [Deltaproteobacteria bacterium]